MRTTWKTLLTFAFAACASLAHAAGMRIDYTAGPVSFAALERPNDWVYAPLGQPVRGGDRIWTDRGGTAELRIGYTAVRLASHTHVEVLPSDPYTLRLHVHQGRVNVAIREPEGQRVVEISTAAGPYVLRQPGTYRVGESGPFYDDFDRWSAERDALLDRYAQPYYAPAPVVQYREPYYTTPGPVWAPAPIIVHRHYSAPYRSYDHGGWRDNRDNRDRRVDRREPDRRDTPRAQVRQAPPPAVSPAAQAAQTAAAQRAAASEGHTGNARTMNTDEGRRRVRTRPSD